MAVTKLLELEFGDSINSIARMTAELKVLKAQFKEAEIGTTTFDTLGKEVKTLETEIKKLTNVTKENTNALGGINTSAKFADNSLGKLKQQIKENNEQLLKVNVNGKLYKALQAEQAIAVQKRIDIEKKLPSLFQERIKGAIDEANTLKGLKDEIKKYTAAVIAGEEGAAEKLAELKDKLNDVKDATSTFAGSGVEKLTGSMNLLTESITNFDGEKFSTALKGIGGAMKAIPIFLILEGIKLLVENFDALFNFAQSFSDSAKEVKKLTKEFEALQIVTARNTAAINAAITVQEAELAVLEARGASNDVILAQEQKIYKSKIDLLKVQAAELKASGLLALAKKRQVLDNDSVYESGLRLEAQVQRKLGNDKAAEIYEVLIAQNKKERNEENNKQIEEAFNGAKTLSGELTALMLNNDAKIITSNKERTEKTIDSARQIRQAQIDNIENVYQRQLAQIQFDEDNALQDLKRNKDFLSKKAQLEKEILEKARQENIQAAREEKIRLEGIANELSQAKIDLIKNDYERQKEQIQLNEQKALQDAENTIINNAALLFETKKNITAKYAEEERVLALEYVKKDMEAAAEYNVIKSTQYQEQFTARMEQLELQKQTELENINLTENERLRIIQEYNLKEINLEQEKQQQKNKIRDTEIALTAAGFTVLNNLAILFNNDQEELAKLSKIGSLISIGANTATAISGLIATSFAPTQADNLVNPLAPYLKIASGVVAITSNMLQAKQILNSFEEGGYTGDGNPSEVSTNLGAKPYTYHKSEYVIPARVLGTQKGAELANLAEGMRLGISNPKPFIGGFYDGGFTKRAASSGVETTFMQNRMLQDAISKMPQPVVRVTDINKVQSGVERAVITSAL